MAKRVRSMVDFLNGATVDDLADLEGEIKAKQDAADLAAEVAQREIKPLLELRKLLDLRINGKKPRKNAKGKDKAVGGEGSVRDRAYEVLAKAGGGPLSAAEIASRVGCHVTAIYTQLKHEWFTKSAEGYEIAKT